jgi:hypothetical protein
MVDKPGMRGRGQSALSRHRSHSKFLLQFSAASRRFKEFVGRGGLLRDEIPRSFRTFILSPTNSWPHDFEFAMNLNSPSLDAPRSLSDLLMNIVSSAGIFVAMAGICLDRLLKQRSALQKPDSPFDSPPPRGGLRSLSVGADCLATESRALSELLS